MLCGIRHQDFIPSILAIMSWKLCLAWFPPPPDLLLEFATFASNQLYSGQSCSSLMWAANKDLRFLSGLNFFLQNSHSHIFLFSSCLCTFSKCDFKTCPFISLFSQNLHRNLREISSPFWRDFRAAISSAKGLCVPRTCDRKSAAVWYLIWPTLSISNIYPWIHSSVSSLLSTFRQCSVTKAVMALQNLLVQKVISTILAMFGHVIFLEIIFHSLDFGGVYSLEVSF